MIMIITKLFLESILNNIINFKSRNAYKIIDTKKMIIHIDFIIIYRDPTVQRGK